MRRYLDRRKIAVRKDFIQTSFNYWKRLSDATQGILASYNQERKRSRGRDYFRLQVHPGSLEEDTDGGCIGDWRQEGWDRAAESASIGDWMHSVCAYCILWLEDRDSCCKACCKVVALIPGIYKIFQSIRRSLLNSSSIPENLGYDLHGPRIRGRTRSCVVLVRKLAFFMLKSYAEKRSICLKQGFINQIFRIRNFQVKIHFISLFSI